MSNPSLIREYYGRIDQSDVDWVVALFEEDAVYERADALYTGIDEIRRFFREERLIKGTHHIDNLIGSNQGDFVVAVGRFSGVGSAGDPREVRFADVWKFGAPGRVKRRQTFLALGNQYIRA
jgi:ketosteroid isomerase-like protein